MSGMIAVEGIGGNRKSRADPGLGASRTPDSRKRLNVVIQPPDEQLPRRRPG